MFGAWSASSSARTSPAFRCRKMQPLDLPEVDANTMGFADREDVAELLRSLYKLGSSLELHKLILPSLNEFWHQNNQHRTWVLQQNVSRVSRWNTCGKGRLKAGRKVALWSNVAMPWKVICIHFGGSFPKFLLVASVAQPTIPLLFLSSSSFDTT